MYTKIYVMYYPDSLSGMKDLLSQLLGVLPENGLIRMGIALLKTACIQ